MKQISALLKKDTLNHIRSGHLILNLIVFALLGIMNPAIAKMTPWLLEIFANSLAETGINITSIDVNALTSWTQFYKNIPMGLIFFVFLESDILTKEYKSKTLVLSLTKGLSRYKVLVSKFAVILAQWSISYWLCYLITYFYNAFFWDNSIAYNLVFSAICYYVGGIFVISLIVVFSTIFESNTLVLLSTASSVFLSYIISLFPKIKTISLWNLLSSGNLIYAPSEIDFYIRTIIICAIMLLLEIYVSIQIFNRKSF